MSIEDSQTFSVDMLIDVTILELENTNPIEVAEFIEQYFGVEVNIDYVQFYMEKHGEYTDKSRSDYYITCRP